MTQAGLQQYDLDVRPEVERLVTVIQPAITGPEHEIHFVSDVFDVLLGIESWNDQIGDPALTPLWGRRTVQYSAHDPRTQMCAPSKFCAFFPVVLGVVTNRRSLTLSTYASLDETEARFDGYRAQQHLSSCLGMRKVARGVDASLDAAFERWMASRSYAVRENPKGAVFLTPPRCTGIGCGSTITRGQASTRSG